MKFVKNIVTALLGSSENDLEDSPTVWIHPADFVHR